MLILRYQLFYVSIGPSLLHPTVFNSYHPVKSKNFWKNGGTEKTKRMPKT